MGPSPPHPHPHPLNELNINFKEDATASTTLSHGSVTVHHILPYMSVCLNLQIRGTKLKPAQLIRQRLLKNPYDERFCMRSVSPRGKKRFLWFLAVPMVPTFPVIFKNFRVDSIGLYQSPLELIKICEHLRKSTIILRSPSKTIKKSQEVKSGS